ncbi:MAG: hypothetical protein K5848_05970 [Lachnospiraceae bacterium]|nr:hypothetical protein [Lachnospiraceae bacterium]
MNKKITAVILAVLVIAGIIAGAVILKKKKGGSATPATAAKATADSASAVATATPTPLPYELSWEYEIRQNGFYNSAAVWDEEGMLLEAPTYEVGSTVYYNDCDEYYNNFMPTSNNFGGAMVSIDDIHAHSSDNSEKITSRLQSTKGFAGLDFGINANNVLDISKLQGKTVTFGMFVYYTDEFGLGVADSLTFAFWSNLNPAEDAAAEVKSSEETAPEAFAEETLANEKGFYKIKTFDLAPNTWNYVEVTTKVNTAEPSPSLYFATLGEVYNPIVSCYVPFYIDDLHMEIVG